jgi:small subunit ribosomal protein S9
VCMQRGALAGGTRQPSLATDLHHPPLTHRHLHHLGRSSHVFKPFLLTGKVGQFDVAARVEGGGISGQAQAVAHAIGRALKAFEPGMRTELRRLGLLRRDPRMVERKKPGRAKARKSFTWVKR